MFRSRDYYINEQDTSLPSELGNENIILTVKGMQEIADHYNEKFGIAIIPFGSTMTFAPKEIATLISRARENAPNEGIHRVGFIFNNTRMGNYGHAMPMIWEKNGDKESLFFLDTGQYLGDTSYQDYDCDFIRMSSFDINTQLDSLPGNSRNAYILVDDNLFYIDKNTNEITQPLMCEDLFSGDVSLDTDNLDQVNTLARLFNFTPHNKDCSYVKLNEENIVACENLIRYTKNRRGRDALNFRQNLKQLLPDVELYSHVGKRQIDTSSCTTDAMVVLRDGLRLPSPLTEIAKNKEAYKAGDLNLIYMPEELLKTAQIGSYPEKSKANLDKPVHVKHVKDKTGKRTGEEISISLAAFRQKYDVVVTSRNVKKTVGRYTVHKGESFSEIIKQRWEEKQKTQATSNNNENNPIDSGNNTPGMNKP